MSRHELDLPEDEQIQQKPATYTTREFLKLLGASVLAPAAAAEFLAACRPRTGAHTETAAAVPKDIPISDRALMPQEMITATQEAARPTPEGLPTASNIKIVREFINPCLTEQVLGSESVWGGWLVKLENSSYYLKKGSFSLEKRTPSGIPIGSPIPLHSNMLPGGTEFFIPAMTGTLVQTYHTGGNSKLGGITLKMGKMEWAKVDDSVREYNFDIALPEEPLSYTTPNQFRSDSGPPKLQFKVNFENKGETEIRNMGASAIITNEAGQLLDILGTGALLGGGFPVPYGQRRELSLTSLTYQANNIGRLFSCATPPSQGARIDYWVYFTTRTGMPVVHQATIQIDPRNILLSQ